MYKQSLKVQNRTCIKDLVGVMEAVGLGEVNDRRRETGAVREEAGEEAMTRRLTARREVGEVAARGVERGSGGASW